MDMNCLSRSKKLPPPPLCLPATNPIVDEDKSFNSQLQRERKRSTNTCCLSSSAADECSHQPIPYVIRILKQTNRNHIFFRSFRLVNVHKFLTF